MIVCIGFMAAIIGLLSLALRLEFRRGSRCLRIKPSRPQPVTSCDLSVNYPPTASMASCKMMYFLSTFCFIFNIDFPFLLYFYIYALISPPLDQRRTSNLNLGRRRCNAYRRRSRIEKLASCLHSHETKVQCCRQIWETVPRKVPLKNISDGTISSTLKSIRNPGLKKRKNCSLKLIKSTETGGSIFPNSLKAGNFQVNLRTDNSIKNHFYSTIRRSLRRICKLLGNKNSTSELRNIKPSILSKIFEYSELKGDQVTEEN
jgi:hypothetical protein